MKRMVRLCRVKLSTKCYTRVSEKCEIFLGGRRGASVVAGADKGRETVDPGAAAGVSLRVREAGGDRESRRDKWVKIPRSRLDPPPPSLPKRPMIEETRAENWSRSQSIASRIWRRIRSSSIRSHVRRDATRRDPRIARRAECGMQICACVPSPLSRPSLFSPPFSFHTRVVWLQSFWIRTDGTTRRKSCRRTWASPSEPNTIRRGAILYFAIDGQNCTSYVLKKKWIITFIFCPGIKRYNFVFQWRNWIVPTCLYYLSNPLRIKKQHTKNFYIKTFSELYYYRTRDLSVVLSFDRRYGKISLWDRRDYGDRWIRSQLGGKIAAGRLRVCKCTK